MPSASTSPYGRPVSKGPMDGITRTYSVLGHLKRDLDVRLGTQVIDLRWPNLGNDIDEVGAVAEIAVVQLELSRACK